MSLGLANRWRPQPKQALFLEATEEQVFYGGAKGGGKTDALLMYAWTLCQAYRGARVVMLRRTYADLSKGGAAIDRSHELFTGHARYTGGDHRWTFDNGSVFEFGHLQHPTSIYAYQGAQYDAVLWDELTQFTPEQYDYIWGSVRSPRGYPTAFRATGNPGGIGHGWVKKRFINPRPWGEPFEITNDEAEIVGTGRFIPAKLVDNPALLNSDPGYQRRLRAMPEGLRRALADGDWNVFEGQVFVEWDDATHTLPPFAIPPTWSRVCGLDWGTARPFVCLWIATGPRHGSDPPANRPCDRQHRYVYRELSQVGLRDEEQARQVATMSLGESIGGYHADPASFFARPFSTGVRPADVFAAAGVRLVPSNNDRIPGKRAVEQALARCACGVPRLRVFQTCQELIRTLPSLPYDKVQPEDVDTDAEDDQYDALRYGLMGPGRNLGKTDVLGFSTGGWTHA